MTLRVSSDASILVRAAIAVLATTTLVPEVEAGKR